MKLDSLDKFQLPSDQAESQAESQAETAASSSASTLASASPQLGVESQAQRESIAPPPDFHLAPAPRG